MGIKSVFIDGKESTKQLPIKAGSFYYMWSHIPASIVYVTRVEGKHVYYVYYKDRSRDKKDHTEHIHDLEFFALTAFKALHNMQQESAYRLEVKQVLNDSLEAPIGYTTFEEEREKRDKKHKEREEIRKKTTYMDVVETAKIARQLLKEHFPGVKFSVRSERYTGGSSLTITWVDGPTTNEAESIVGYMKAGYFDGMIDLYKYKGPQKQADGSYITWGCEYFTFNRHLSLESWQQLRAEVSKKWGVNPDDFPILESGKYYYIERDTYAQEQLMQQSGADMNHHITRLAQDRSFFVAPDKPAQKPENKPQESTASGVTYGDYKGHPTIGLPMPNGKTFNFGLSKAQAILDNIDAIKAWVESQQ